MEAVFYSSMAGAASVIGILLVMRWSAWTIEHSHFVNSLAAGVILGVAFFSLIPEAYGLSPHAVHFVFLGFVVFYLMETIVVVHAGPEIFFHRERDQESHAHVHGSQAWMVFAGLFLHSCIDGMVIGVGFEASHELGVMTALSVILHELPEGVTIFVLLITRIKKRSALFLSVVVGLATPMGTLLGLAVLPGMGHSSLGVLLALAAGSFVYIGASDLIPETHTHKGWKNALFFVAGALLAYVLSQKGMP